MKRADFPWPETFDNDLKAMILCITGARRNLIEPVEFCPDLKEHILVYLDFFNKMLIDRWGNVRWLTIVTLSIKILATTTWYYNMAKVGGPQTVYAEEDYDTELNPKRIYDTLNALRADKHEHGDN